MYLTQPHFSHMYIAVLRCSGVKKIIVMCLLIVFFVINRNNDSIYLFVVQMFSEPNGSKTNSCDRREIHKDIQI